MSVLGKLITTDLPNTKSIDIISPINGKTIELDDVPDPLFQHRLYGEGVAIQPSGFQVYAPFDGKVVAFSERANQIRLKAKNGLLLQIQLGIDSDVMMGDGFKRLKKPGDSVNQGEPIAEFSLIKMRRQLSCTLCPVTVINCENVRGIQGHYYSIVALQDKIMTLYF